MRTEAELRAKLTALDAEIEADDWPDDEWTWSDATTARATIAWVLGEQEEF
jgi:hypothetical protein